MNRNPKIAIRGALLPVGLAAGIGLVAMPGVVLAYTLLGISLGISTVGNGYQRDVRVDNTFADASANNNNVPEANHPGALGAPLAVWKGAQAWASDTFDAQINAFVNKNFDIDWQGAASNPNAGNVVSANDPLASCSGGVLAYTEPTSGGWRMSFCDASWNWSDGPGAPSGAQIDIQGVAAHEYGHALGLGHSQTANCPGSGCSNNPTMCAFICGAGTSARDLAQDDINGLGAIYGVAPANKPHISGISGSTMIGGLLTITGTNFAGTVNVKFTAGTSQNTGTIPGVVYNVVSSGGTTINVTIPNEAQSGNVLVWEPAQSLLSNAFPIAVLPCPTPTNFCTASPNSFSPTGATLTFSGGTLIPDNNFVLQSFADIPPNKTCLAFYGMNTSINVVFGDGRRCIANPFYRIYPVQMSNVFGDVEYPVDLNTLPAAGQIHAGETWGFQIMYRDPANGGAGFNSTDGLLTTWCQ
jgi:hypothetical protein